MDVTTQKYHLLLTALEASTIIALEKLFHQHAKPALAQKRIHTAQLQASSIGSQLGHAQLEDKLPDEQLPPSHGYTAIKPIAIEAGITIGMLGVIARTAIIEAFRKSAIAVYSANDIESWVWEAEGDNPCDFCISMDGTIHPITEEFESHPNCRCGTSPYVA